MTKEERKTYMKGWRAKNRDAQRLRAKKWREDNPTKTKQYNRAYVLANPEVQMLSSARERAKKLGLPFDLTKEDIVIPDVCPVLGITLERVPGVWHDASPSLDRVLPELGYVKSNIQVMSMRANRIKNDGTAEEHEQIAKYMRNFSGTK